MNIYAMVDLEGISGLYCREQMTPDKAEAVLTDAITRAIENLRAGKVGHYEIEKPARLRAEYVEHTQLPTPAAKPYTTLIDGRTVEVTGNTAEEALFRLL